MSNSFYNHGSTPVFRSQGLSSLIRAEFDAITAGFNKLPALSAGVARRLVAVNAAGDALETIFSGYHGAGNPTVITTNTALGLTTLAVNTTGYNNTAIGYQCLAANTTGPANTAVGTAALSVNTTGSTNTAIGSSVLSANTAGVANTGVGSGALQSVVTGSHNTGVGGTALAGVTGSENTAMGYLAGWRITTGQYNTIVGSQAVYAANVTADGMTAIGYGALAANVSGAGNTAVGYQALTLATGGYNTAVGYNALVANTSGIVNTAVGHAALGGCTTGGSNAALGQGALSDLTTGSNNTALGTGSGLNVVATSQTTSIGYGARANAPGLTNFTALGYNAVATASNQMMFGDTNVTENVFHGVIKGQAGTGTGVPIMIGMLSVNVTSVGNVGAGLQSLMTYSLPANSLVGSGKGIRIRAWGSGANNANAKTVTLMFGLTSMLSFNLPTGSSQYWEIEATVYRFGLNEQRYFAEGSSGLTGAVPTAGARVFGGGATETETSAISIDLQGNATTNNDIVQFGMTVEFIN